MKFCLSVCELNPLHNGHIKLISEMKNRGDAVILIMSGNFCQRGEAAVTDKYARARHAILAGADMVVELPAVFSCAPAEIFAKGAIKLLSSIKGEKTLFFGAESGGKEDFIKLAGVLSDEDKNFKRVLKEELKQGAPFAVARYNTLKRTCPDTDLSMLETPNSILGLEYAKAISYFGSDIDICPIERENNFASNALGEKYCSSYAVREAIKEGKVKKVKSYLPDYVYGDLPKTLPDISKTALYSVLKADGKDLKRITDCSEGLENRIKAMARGVSSLNELIDRLETRRYTRARLSRIITANMLGLDREFTEKCLKANLYLKVLAIKNERKDLLSVKTDKTPVLTRKTDFEKLSGTSRDCFLKDVFACDVYSLSSGAKVNEFEMKIVK